MRKRTGADSLPVGKHPSCTCANDLAANMGKDRYFPVNSVLEYGFEYYCEVAVSIKGEMGSRKFLGRSDISFCPICGKEWK
jgi:hypothetical protein